MEQALKTLSLWRVAALAIATLASACAPNQTRLGSLGAAKLDPGSSLHPANETPQGDLADLRKWIADVEAVYRSRAFRVNLRVLASDHAEVWLSSNLGYFSVGALADAVTGIDGRFRYVTATVTLQGGADDGRALAGYAGVAADGRTGLASMTLGRLHLQRYRSSDVVERSCAINTMAHERAHTLTNTRPTFLHAIEDTGKGAAPAGSVTPLASYLIGATAQCTYLQQHGRVSATGLRACLAVFGTNSFNSNRCTQFHSTVPVRERPGLAAPARPITT